MAADRKGTRDPLARRSVSREVWLGVFALVGVLSVVVTLLALTDPGMFRGRVAVATVVADAGGLRRGDPVQMRGVNIGRVQGFDIGQDSVRVELELERAYPVPDDSYIRLRSSGLLGGMVVEVIPGASPDDLEGGEVLPGDIQRGLLDPAGGVSVRADTVLTRVQELLSRETVADVGASVAELRLLLDELSGLVGEQRRELAGLGTSLRAGAANIERATAGPELGRAIARTDTVTARLNAASLRLQDASESLGLVLQRVEQGEGTLGRLSADPALYENLNEAALEFRVATRSLNTLLEDIRANPRRYLNLEIF